MFRPGLACALAATLSACGGNLSAAGCVRDSDCPSPQTCTAGQCVSSGCGVGSSTCAADPDCGIGQHCANGCCALGQVGSCAKDADCSGHAATPHCDTGKGQCAQCVQNVDCRKGLVCLADACTAPAGCSSSLDCKDPQAPICDVPLKSCVQCLSAKDCSATPLTPSCSSQHQCVKSSNCESDVDCHDPSTPKCQTPSGNCVGCLTTADCKKPGLVCTVDNTCQAPSATGCTADKDCASNLQDPHCKAGTGGAAGVCVACLLDNQCPADESCDLASNSCKVKQCAGDTDCKKPAPRCDLTDSPHVCVACLGNADCPNSGTCQPDHTCKAATAGCTSDATCASSVAGPHCDTKSGQCVACTDSSQCAGGLVCSPQETCVPNTCTSDSGCVSLPQTPHCSGNAASPGTCVQCTTAAQCGVGFRCSSNACVPICTAATQAQDCSQPTPVCKETALGNHCVQCVADPDCGGGQVCDPNDNLCKVPAASGCASNTDCTLSQPVCDTQLRPHACVQCLVSSDCKNGLGCDPAAHTCTLTGGLGEACNPDFTCNAGLLCLSGPGGLTASCAQACSPYASSGCASAGAGLVCEWLGFDENNSFIGACQPANAHGQQGAACDPAQVDSCEWNLLCAQTSATAGVCRSLCSPGSSCGGATCNTIVGAEAGSTVLSIGYCGPGSRWEEPCITDTPSGTAGPDCGDALANAGKGGLYCAPSTLVAENPQLSVRGLCSYAPAAATAIGHAGSSCSAHGGSDCRSGLCLSDGPVTCFSGCQFTADCRRDSGSSSVFCFGVDFEVSSKKANMIGSCEPTCRTDADCSVLGGGITRSCVPQPTFLGSSWRAVCNPAVGAGGAGAACATSTDCASGTCVTGAVLQSIELGEHAAGAAPDGYCLGSCSSDTDCAGSGTFCNQYAALPLTPQDTGYTGVSGVANPGVCWGLPCGRDGDCAGLSADPSSPRVCAPYKYAYLARTDSPSCTVDSDCQLSGNPDIAPTCNSAANNPDPGGTLAPNAGIYGPNGVCRQVAWDVQCAPGLGASLRTAGQGCAQDTDCQTGHCLDTGSAKVCFGACTSSADCATGTTCASGSYLGLFQSYCQ